MPDDVTIRTARANDAAAIAAIYNHYIAHTVVTFEEEPVSAEEMAARIGEVQAASLPWLVAERGAERSGQIVGYAYATRWKTRASYRHSVEITVYLAPEQSGRGIGPKLYAQLFTSLQACGIHAVIGGIALPNDVSVALHEKFGFEKIAHFREVGFKFNRWVDVGYWQKIF